MSFATRTLTFTCARRDYETNRTNRLTESISRNAQQPNQLALDLAQLEHYTMFVGSPTSNQCETANDPNNNNNSNNSSAANECFVVDQLINPFEPQQPQQQQHINAKLYLMSTAPATLKNAQKTKVRLAKQGKNNGGLAATIVQHEPLDSSGTCSSGATANGHYNLQTDV